AAASALKAAKQGSKTLIISTDPAHSLSDAFDLAIGPEPTAIRENLWAQELDVYYSMQKYWGNLRQLMLTVFRWQGIKNVMAEELTAIPGMEEGAAFLWIEKYYAEKFFDLIVIDSAPTGETLTLLTLPQVTQWWVTKAFPAQKFAIKALGRVVRTATGIPLDKGYDELNNLFEKLIEINKVFADHKVCSVRIVTNAERMVINESKRAYTYLQLYGYNVDAVIINRLWSNELAPPRFAQILAIQEEHSQTIVESFSPIPILRIEHRGNEVFGQELLAELADEAYGLQTVRDVFHTEQLYTIEQHQSGYLVQLKLKFIAQSDYTLSKFGDELVINIANRRHNFYLPRFAHLYKLGSHEYINPWLRVFLVK
ncbi:MAG: arsenite-activated ATPase (arsA) subfamily protein, partial [Bacteroidota bacterium]